MSVNLASLAINLTWQQDNANNYLQIVYRWILFQEYVPNATVLQYSDQLAAFLILQIVLVIIFMEDVIVVILDLFRSEDYANLLQQIVSNLELIIQYAQFAIKATIFGITFVTKMFKDAQHTHKKVTVLNAVQTINLLTVNVFSEIPTVWLRI